MADFSWERKILKTSNSVAGVDEAGRGAWAGPVVVAMVILNSQKISSKINDSKKISPLTREKLAYEIKETAITYTISIVSAEDIDKNNILQATLIGVNRCYQSITPKPGHLLLDALHLPTLEIPQTKLIKGDEISYSIAAASILAKTTRDTIMVSLSQQYPEYQFNKNKGYGVKAHLEALKKFGLTPLHRKTFRPIRDWETLNLFDNKN